MIYNGKEKITVGNNKECFEIYKKIQHLYRNYGKLSLILQPVCPILKTVRHV